MYVLGIDTATNSGGVALGRNQEVIGFVMLKTPLRYQEKIIDLIDFLLRQHDLTLKEIGCLAVVTGPGSFTGLRIGLATVKAFAQSLAKPIVGVSTLEALAYRFRWAHPRISAMMDARRQQVFAGAYRVEGPQLAADTVEQVGRPEEFLRRLPQGEYLFVGDGAHVYADTVRALRPESRVVESDNFLLDSLCGLAYRRALQGRTERAETLQGHYLRPSDAELQKLG